MIENLDEAGMVVFAPQDVKSTITVFTDTSCGYCVKLHQEIAQTVAGGVKVRYLGFPRSGLNSSSGETLVSVWCADNRQQAMTEQKGGSPLKPRPVKPRLAAIGSRRTGRGSWDADLCAGGRDRYTGLCARR
ncbi:MAG: hypothetical protein Ct9H300mP14_13090 [Gammaproteobacteria bacterium]|nr:MAG: hypothetical protein Ct9H300mP14_13090 [Gammaproteobacteria bacterium]